MKLHEYHRRKLAATTRLLDDTLGRMESFLTGPAQPLLGREIVESFNPAEKAALLSGIQRLREDLIALNQDFELEKDQLDSRQVIQAGVSSVWVWLENCRPERMKGYGVAFDPALRAALEQHIERILAQVQNLRLVLR